MEEYYNRVNQDLMRLIPPDAAVVAEVGCGAGALGREYLRLNPRCRYVGLEISPEAAAIAATRLSAVQVGNAETLDLAESDVDCLVYGDVLEHLTDPWAVLRRHAASLKEGGQVVACIPNIGHWSVIADLMQGRWRYRTEGLLDHTHLRFFTQEGMQELFAQAGLNVFEIRPRPIHGQGFEEFQALFGPIAEKMGVESRRFADATGALQYLVRAVKGPLPSRLLVQSLLGETKVCARVRILEPHSFLATIPGVRIRSEAQTAHLESGAPGEAKVFIWQRVWAQDMAQQEELIRRGYLVLAEMDDDPLRWPVHQANDFIAFRSCHGVQVSTEPLAEFLRQYNPNVAVFPNQLAYLPEPRIYQERGAVTLFFGALNREEDWQAVMEPLNAVLKHCGERVKVVVVHDRAFFDALKTDGKEFLPFCPYPEYTAALRRADIAILPLLPTRFNRMKSDLKFLECAAHGVATLASPTVYEQSIEEGKTGLIYRNPAEFAEKLVLLIGDAGFRRDIAAHAYQWVVGHRMLRDHYRQRYEWYLSMVRRLPELEEGLRSRLRGG